MLKTRRVRVILVTATASHEVHLTQEEALSGLEIEEPIVAEVVCFFLHYLKQKTTIFC